MKRLFLCLSLLYLVGCQESTCNNILFSCDFNNIKYYGEESFLLEGTFIHEIKKNIKTWQVWVIGLVILGFLGNIIGKVSKPNACDCVDLMNKERMIGFGNLFFDDKKAYNKCVDAYDTFAKAGNKCVDGVYNKMKGIK
ncbi:MAG: hypothetical protein O3A67_05140 [Bacteroidetes bacterium]|nr:hypothetical protein [Bacteroidota bacterium]